MKLYHAHVDVERQPGVLVTESRYVVAESSSSAAWIAKTVGTVRSLYQSTMPVLWQIPTADDAFPMRAHAEILALKSTIAGLRTRLLNAEADAERCRKLADMRDRAEIASAFAEIDRLRQSFVPMRYEPVPPASRWRCAVCHEPPLWVVLGGALAAAVVVTAALVFALGGR